MVTFAPGSRANSAPDPPTISSFGQATRDIAMKNAIPAKPENIGRVRSYFGLISRDAKGNVGFTYSIVICNLH